MKNCRLVIGVAWKFNSIISSYASDHLILFLLYWPKCTSTWYYLYTKYVFDHQFVVCSTRIYILSNISIELWIVSNDEFQFGAFISHPIHWNGNECLRHAGMQNYVLDLCTAKNEAYNSKNEYKCILKMKSNIFALDKTKNHIWILTYILCTSSGLGTECTKLHIEEFNGRKPNYMHHAFMHHIAHSI